MDQLKNIQFYKEMYDLPELVYEEEVPEGLFGEYKNSHFFVVLVIYNSKKEFFLFRDFNKGVGWELPGSHVPTGEQMTDSVDRLARTEAGVSIDEMEPLAIVVNRFRYGEHVLQHTGVAFAALSRDMPTAGNNKHSIRGIFTSKTPHPVAYQNDKVIKFFQERFRGRTIHPPLEEIESGKRSHIVHAINKYVVRFIGWFASQQQFRNLVQMAVGQPYSILDASCGDSNVIQKLNKHFSPRFAVGNDISWKTISLIKQRFANVFYTNHNVYNLPFVMPFDLVIFKNTLHHIPSTHHRKILEKLQNISEQLIVIDIEDPQNTSIRARVWNWYYRFFLKDQGGDFLQFNEFKKIVKSSVSNRTKVRFKRIPTIKGHYMLASIEKQANYQ